MNVLTKLLRDDLGASAGEYALILAIIGTAVAGVAFALSGAIATAISDASTCITTAGAAAC